MNYQIDAIAEAEYSDVVAVWEASIRATHHFLREEDIQFYKPLILNEYLKAVELYRYAVFQTVTHSKTDPS